MLVTYTPRSGDVDSTLGIGVTLSLLNDRAQKFKPSDSTIDPNYASQKSFNFSHCLLKYL